MQISTSTYGEASTCLKKYEYHIVDGLVARPNTIGRPIRMGIWIHRALEAYHRGDDVRAALTPMVDFALEHGVLQDEIQSILADLQKILRGYVLYWRQHGKPWEVIASEEALFFEARGHTFRATPDLLVREDGRIWLVESKSTQTIPDATWRAIDPQTMLQFIACHKNGIPVEGVIFNYLVTKMPSVPQFTKTGKTPGMPYANTSVTTTWAWARGIQEMINERGHDYVAERRAALDEAAAQYTSDGAFYQRYYVRKPVEMLKEVMSDVFATMGALEDAQARGHYRRSWNVFSCSRFCFYRELCALEQVNGGRAEGLREALFVQETPEMRAAGRGSS